jgi:esterase/lipase superfamily enzyme
MLILGAALATPQFGCAPAWKMMPPPVAFADDRLDPFHATPDERRSASIDILFATDRGKRDTENPEYAYDAERHTALRLGVATVRIGPADASPVDVEAAARAGRRPSMRITAIDEFGPLWTTISSADSEAHRAAALSTSPDDPIRAPTRRFVDEINARLADADTNDVLVYIPGFNTPFATPVHMMAQFEYFMGRDVVCIAYSWPAQDTFFGYGKQLQVAGTTVRKVRELLVLLAAETDAERIHLVGYSSGARVLSNALLQLRLVHAETPPELVREQARIGHVVFAGADEDVEYVRGLALDRVGDLLESVTIYMSRTDAAMTLARVFGDGTARLGNAIRHLSPLELEILSAQTRASVVDVTSAVRAAGGGDIWAHAYWYLNPWVNNDVITLFRYGLQPGERALERAEDGALWTFPRDYPESITEILEAKTP